MPYLHASRGHRVPFAAAFAILVVVGMLLPLAAAGAAQPGSAATEAVVAERLPDEQASIVEVSVADTAELDRLVGTGVDLDHHVTRLADRIVVHAVVTPSQMDSLRGFGFQVGTTLFREGDSAARVKEREDTIAAHKADNQAFQAR